MVRNTDTTMDWMYEGPAAQQQQFGEEYLLGKVYKPENDATGTAGVDLRRGTALFVHAFQEFFRLYLCPAEKDPGSLWMNKVNAKNDSFTRLHEDPLLSIRKQEKTVSVCCSVVYLSTNVCLWFHTGSRRHHPQPG